MEQTKSTDIRMLNTGAFKRKNRFLTRLLVGFCVVVFFAVFASVLLHFINIRKPFSIRYAYAKWNAYDYQAVYTTTSAILQSKPFNNAALTLHGYAAFFLSLAEMNTLQAQAYLDESINNLRVSLFSAPKKSVPQIEYMLGKAYFYKNAMSSHYYYADLAVQYLLRSHEHGYRANDIPEYLGLSYAALDMTIESIAAFTEALLVRESDLLLLSIAEQYYKAGQITAATQYLYRISVDCKDEKIVQKSHILLAHIAITQEKYAEAEALFLQILEKNENNADAYYGIGVVYEKQGDVVKARAEWRKALKVQANHADALKKLAEYK